VRERVSRAQSKHHVRYNSQEKLEAANLKHAELGQNGIHREVDNRKTFPTKDTIFLMALLALALVFWLLQR
jgi:hypothetical protein